MMDWSCRMPLSRFSYCIVVEVSVDEVKCFPHIGRFSNGKGKSEGQHSLRRHGCMWAAPESRLKNETIVVRSFTFLPGQFIQTGEWAVHGCSPLNNRSDILSICYKAGAVRTMLWQSLWLRYLRLLLTSGHNLWSLGPGLTTYWHVAS